MRMSDAREIKVRLVGNSAGVARVMVVGLLFCATCIRAAGVEAEQVADRLLVKAKHGVSERTIHELLATHGGWEQSVIQQIGVRLVHVPAARLDAILSRLRRDPRIEFAEPDYILSPQIIPDDPSYPQEWHLLKIQAPQAWDITTGSTNVIIAILDTGVDGSHPDLAGRIVPGWNFYDANSDTSDPNGHGTAVAGTAVAASDNGLGVAALAWNCMIMPIRVADTNGLATTSTIATALTWAADHGARVANISFTVSTSATVTSAAQYFQSDGGVVAASAGNNGKAYTNADNIYMLTVSATDSSDALASWSNTGSNIDLAAPGVGIYTTGLGGGYVSGSGTSFSAPVVAGVAALVLSVNPALTGSDVQNILKQNADDLGAPGWDPGYGWGRVNAYKAVVAAAASLGPPSATITSPSGNSTVSGVVAIEVSATAPSGLTNLVCYIDGAMAGASAATPASFAWDTTQSTNGLHTLQAKACDPAGNTGISAAITVVVQNAPADVTPPTVQITSPPNSAVVSGNSVEVYVTGSDDVGVTKVDLLVDGKYYATSNSSNPVFTWYIAKVGAGTHTLQAVAYDAAGNSARSLVVTITK